MRISGFFRAWIFAVSITSLGAGLGAGCSGTYDFSRSSTHPVDHPQDIIVGNPGRTGPAAPELLKAMCSVIQRCQPEVSENDCSTGLLATGGFGTRLGLSGGGFDPYLNLQTAEQIGILTPKSDAAFSCTTAISIRDCGEPEVMAAYNPSLVNPFAGSPGLVPSSDPSCGAVYSKVGSALMVGGYNGGSPVADTLASNGAPWKSTGSTLPGGAIENAQVLSVNHVLYLLGGDRGGASSALSGVYKSLDGLTWALAGNFPGGSRRTAGVALSFGGELWYLGGADGAGTYANVWSSADQGVTWVDHGNILPQGMNYFSGVVYQNKMWIAGGTNWKNQFSGVYNSSDGITWTNVGNLPTGLFSGAMVVYQDKLWWFGGSQAGSTVASSQVWNSSDGATWSPVGTNTLPAGPDHGHSVIVYDGKLLYSAGYSQGGGTFVSADGMSWSTVNRFPSGSFRTYTGLVAF